MIKLRPHHFLCAFCFQGKGYSDKFVANFTRLVEQLNAPGGDDVPIEIAPHTDDICQPCPHKRGLACESEAKVQQLDASHRQALDLNDQTTITWSEAKQAITTKLSLEQFHTICKPCEWKQSGICESVLRTSGIK